MKHIGLTRALGIVLFFQFAAHAGLLTQPLTAPAAVKFRGVVIDVAGAKVGGAAVTVEGGGLRRELRSDEEGEFEVELPAGAYRVTVEKPGYKKHVWEAFRVAAGAETLHEFRVQAAQAPDIHEVDPRRR